MWWPNPFLTASISPQHISWSQASSSTLVMAYGTVWSANAKPRAPLAAAVVPPPRRRTRPTGRSKGAWTEEQGTKSASSTQRRLASVKDQIYQDNHRLDEITWRHTGPGQMHTSTQQLYLYSVKQLTTCVSVTWTFTLQGKHQYAGSVVVWCGAVGPWSMSLW